MRFCLLTTHSRCHNSRKFYSIIYRTDKIKLLLVMRLAVLILSEIVLIQGSTNTKCV